MTSLSLRSVTPRPASSRVDTTRRWSHLPARLLQEWRLRRAAHEVRQLDDATLHDMGIGRSEIDIAVREGRRSRTRF
jgi:uncharacterized protein YjiS (DUF1127 family)